MKDFRRYLSDGVYGEYRDGMIRLWTERESGVHEIFLDDDVMAELLAMVEEIRTHNELTDGAKP